MTCVRGPQQVAVGYLVYVIRPYQGDPRASNRAHQACDHGWQDTSSALHTDSKNCKHYRRPCGWLDRSIIASVNCLLLRPAKTDNMFTMSCAKTFCFIFHLFVQILYEVCITGYMYACCITGSMLNDKYVSQVNSFPWHTVVTKWFSPAHSGC